MEAKAFQIDGTQFQHGKGEMVFVAAIIKRSYGARCLKRFGIEIRPPARAPPRYQEEPFEFGSIEDIWESIGFIEDRYLWLRRGLAYMPRSAGLSPRKLHTKPEKTVNCSFLGLQVGGKCCNQSHMLQNKSSRWSDEIKQKRD